MARFFLHLNECGKVTADDEGLEAPDLKTARVEALVAAREIMCAEISQGRLCLSCRIEVTNSDGDIVAAIPFRDAITITGLSD